MNKKIKLNRIKFIIIQKYYETLYFNIKIKLLLLNMQTQTI